MSRISSRSPCGASTRTNAWARLAALVAQAKTAPTDEAPPPAISRAEQDAALRETRAFYDEWSSVARAVITRRDQLILLGLATRRSPTPTGARAPVTPIAPVAHDANEDDRDA